MQFYSALSLQMPWLTLDEFRFLASEGIDSKNISEQSLEFLSENRRQAIDKANEILDVCEKNRIQILFPDHPLYPVGFSELEDPPLFLTLEGDWPNRASIAVVGSREPSRYAVDWLNEHLPFILKKTGCVVISGGARGIDLTAHLAAVRAGNPTMVFLPSGLRKVYPRDLERYKNVVIECGGGFVSEFPPSAEMKKFHFIKRNRLIVAASDLVFVTEARRKSGSMLTANIANAMDRTLCTLPTSPAMTSALGSLDLIFNGAFPIRDHLDLTALLSLSSRRVSV